MSQLMMDAKRKALLAYLLLLVLVFAAHLFHLRYFHYLVPLYLVAVPLILRRKINIIFSGRHILLGLIVSLVVLLPFYAFSSAAKGFVLMGMAPAAIQLFSVSFPEEVFFRGFLQEVFGNNLRGAVIGSILFSGAHLPGLLFNGDIYAPLTFFPSLIMGFLYLRTSNVIPSIIFHFLANVVYLGSL
jgi:membrane protease YdiL (CAAX protease family)